MRIRSALVLSVLPVAALAVAAPPAIAGVSGPAFYVDGTLYRTVATPTELSHTGATDSTYDAIYDFAGNQRNVAEAAPGDTDYNGGRWQVHALRFPSGYTAALASADAVDTGVVRAFVCTVNKVPPGKG